MMDAIGPAQYAALLVLAERGVEELHSQRNLKRLMRRGGVETEAAYFPVVATAQLAWLAALFFMVPAGAEVIWPMVGLYVLLLGLRLWVLLTLGSQWTHRIVILPHATPVTAGPYRFLNHPNYVIAVLECFVLPAAFGAWTLGLLMAAISAAVLRYKATLEDRALGR